MNALILSLLVLASPTFEDAMNNDTIYHAVLSSLSNPQYPNEKIAPDSVKYLSFTARMYKDNHVPLNLLLPFQHLRVLNAADGVELTETDALADIPSLKEIVCWRVPFPSMEVLQKLPNLTHLTLRGMDLSDNTAAFLAGCTHVECLDLRYNKLTSLKLFHGLQSLRWLDVTGNPIPKEEIEAFQKARPTVKLFHGDKAEPDEYVQRAWIDIRINAIIKCSVRRTLHYDLVPWKGEIPFGDGEVHSIRLLDTANEAGCCTSDAAVIVHYAKFFQGRAEGPKDHFLDTDKTLQRFIKNTHIPVKDKSPFSFDDLVDWIRAHKDSAILPPSVFLDDILQEWDKHSKP